jgi:hypothetical protein
MKVLFLLWLLKHQVMMVHHTSPEISQSCSQPTFGNSRSSDQPNLYISWSSSQKLCQLDSQAIVEDSQSVDRPTKQSTMIWMHGRLG